METSSQKLSPSKEESGSFTVGTVAADNSNSNQQNTEDELHHDDGEAHGPTTLMQDLSAATPIQL
jgi:hypothetical protein